MVYGDENLRWTHVCFAVWGKGMTLNRPFLMIIHRGSDLAKVYYKKSEHEDGVTWLNEDSQRYLMGLYPNARIQ